MKPSDHELERRLRRGAPRQDAPAGFAEEVTRRLKNSPGAEPAQSRPGASVLQWLRPLVAATAVILLVVINWKPADPLPEAALPTVAYNVPAPGPSLDLVLPEVRVKAFGEFPETLDEPLEKELESILSDARKAVNYLAFNFLPENSAPRWFQSPLPAPGASARGKMFDARSGNPLSANRSCPILCKPWSGPNL